MNNYLKYLKALTLLFPAILLLFILSTGCETEKEVIREVPVTVHDTLIVTVEIHDTVTVFVNGVEVDSIMVNPPMIAQGNWVELTATASLTGDQEFTYAWFATAGQFDAVEGDTVHWKSPDEPGVYTITVHATDGNFVGLGAVNVGVEMYVPTETPYYLGVDACSGCHDGGIGGTQYTTWVGTAHAHAWQTLEESGHAGPSCYPCHSVGFEPAPNTGNSGFDEAPIMKFANVQCENCHGPASEHVSTGSLDLEVSYNVQNCGKCHDGEHHPYLTEWLQSPHNFPGDAHTSSSCIGCHEGVGAALRLAGKSEVPLNVFYGGGGSQPISRPDTTEFPYEPIVCQTCHDPHDATNPGQLRTVTDVVLVAQVSGGSNPVITPGGVGKLCMQCHHARSGPWQHIPNGNVRFGPHHNPQADAISANTGYKGVADSTFYWAGPSHLLVQNSCKTCHLNTIEFPGPSGSAVTGHTFLPTTEACLNCHGPINSFRDIPAAGDFDGDGVVEGLQDEVDGLMVLLRDAIVNNGPGLDTTTSGFVGALGNPALSTLQQREAGWNWVFVYEDRSHGIHNPDYVVQLLQQSYIYIGGTFQNNVTLVKSDNEAVAQW